MNWFLRRRFLVLLITLVLLLAVYPVLRAASEARLLFDVLLTLMFVASFLAIFTLRHLRLAAVLLGVPPLLGAWTGYVLPGLPRLPLAVGFHVLAALFLAFTVATILGVVYRERSVSADGVYGAFCGYMLIGVAFGHVYCVIESLTPGGAFTGVAPGLHLHDEGRLRFLLTYFSFMTLTTVGYGDITPAADVAKGWAMCEAVAGQFYLAVLVAELIGKRVAQVLSGPRSDAKTS